MASSNTTPRIVELAALISSSVAELQERLSAQGAPSPSFAEGGPQTLPANVFHIQDALLDATAELNELLMEPILLIHRFAGLTNMVSIEALCQYNIPDMIPAGGQISFEDIAEKTGLEKGLVRRLLRHAMSMRILAEPEPGMVAHTRISKFMTIPYINSWAKFEAKDTWPANTRIVDAIQKWSSSDEASETGFALANDGKSVFEVLADPERAKRFGSSVQATELVPGHAVELVSKMYDWASLGNVTVVNVGGQQGQAAVELAKSFGNLKLIVQDAAAMIEGAESRVPDQLKERVQFMKRELFEPQTVQADVYFFRMIFRTWGDKYAVQLLKAHVPVLRPGAKLLIQDVCMAEPGTIPLWKQRLQMTVDMNLKCYFNGRFRYLDEWKALLAAADKRFVIHQLHVLEDKSNAILEVHWKAE